MRYPAIDALRGFAALWVAFYHLGNAAELSGPFSLFQHGHLGVYIFFVLSGFVIAKNLSGPVTGRTIGVFAIRRAIRLDPTYWFVLGLTLLAEAYAGRTYSPATICGNLFYLQGLLNLPWIVKVSWTLCLEVQFYLVFALLVWICTTASERRRNVLRTVLFFPLLVVSLLVDVPDYVFLTFWYAFFLGVGSWWVVAGEIRPATQFMVMMLIAVLRPSLPVAAALATSALILSLGLTQQLHRLQAEPLQFFGRISYSLYLIHPLVTRFVRRYHDWPWASFSIGLAASVLLAYVLYVLVERPTHQWARRIRLDRRGEPALSDAETASRA